MSFVLTVASTVMCGHAGTVTVTPPGTAKLTVNGSAVLLEADLKAAVMVCTGNPPNAAGKCSSITQVMDGAPPAKLTVGGKPVVRDGLTGTTSGAPPTLSAIAGQTKLTTT